MELKYYLRGLGLGIVVTAIIMGIASSKSKVMTNEEIIARAKQLGMTENTVLTEMDSEKNEEDAASLDADSQNANSQNEDTEDSELKDNDISSGAGDGASNDDTANMQTDEDKISGNDNGADSSVNDSGLDTGKDNSGTGSRVTDSGTDAEAADPGERADKGNTGIASESIVITVGSGDGSYSVSKKLEDVGAVSSAGDFDTFLCQNGYDKRIRAGTYTIPANASEEQMARIITGAE